MTETLRACATHVGSRHRNGSIASGVRPDIDQRDPARAGAGAQQMLAEDAAQLQLERVEVVLGERLLRVPARASNSPVDPLAEKIGPEVAAIVLAERRRLAKERRQSSAKTPRRRAAARADASAASVRHSAMHQARVDPLPHASPNSSTGRGYSSIQPTSAPRRRGRDAIGGQVAHAVVLVRPHDGVVRQDDDRRRAPARTAAPARRCRGPTRRTRAACCRRSRDRCSSSIADFASLAARVVDDNAANARIGKSALECRDAEARAPPARAPVRTRGGPDRPLGVMIASKITIRRASRRGPPPAERALELVEASRQAVHRGPPSLDIRVALLESLMHSGDFGVPASSSADPYADELRRPLLEAAAEHGGFAVRDAQFLAHLPKLSGDVLDVRDAVSFSLRSASMSDLAAARSRSASRRARLRAPRDSEDGASARA